MRSLLMLSLALVGCGTLLDIDDIDFGDSASSGGGGAATTTSSTAGQGPGSGGNAPGEICNNAVDDDADGDVDCADADCSDWTCAPTVDDPEFQGPVIVTASDAPDTCPPHFDRGGFELFESVSSAPADCAPCDCDVDSIVCGASTVTFYAGPNCSGDSQSHPTTIPNVCTPLNVFPSSARADPTTVTGMCSVTGGGIANLPAIATNGLGLSCEASPGAGCSDTTSACVPTPQPMSQICVFTVTDKPCPAPYTLRNPYLHRCG